MYLFAKISPKPEFMAAARRAIEDIVSLTLQEPGCRKFVLHEGVGDGCLYLYEEWVDEAALERHYLQPYIAAVFEAYKEWLSEPVEITKLSRLS